MQQASRCGISVYRPRRYSFSLSKARNHTLFGARGPGRD